MTNEEGTENMDTVERHSDMAGMTLDDLRKQAEAGVNALKEVGVEASMADDGQVEWPADKEVERPFYYRAYKRGLEAIGKPVCSYDEWLARYLARNGVEQ